ncbi:MAG: group III truncated hemoglobin [Rhizomicrobium sp.]
MRLPGDVLFAIGALLMAWDFIVKLRPLYPEALDRMIFRTRLEPLTQPAQARRAAITSQIQAEAGIDEAMIERLVRDFYVRVRNDTVLGPIFAARIENWEPHLQKMFAFWSSVALMSGRYHGQPMARHLPLPIDARHFDRWLALFAETARDVCPPAAAEHFIHLSHRVGESLELGIANSNGILLRKGQRYFRVPGKSASGRAGDDADAADANQGMDAQ